MERGTMPGDDKKNRETFFRFITYMKTIIEKYRELILILFHHLDEDYI